MRLLDFSVVTAAITRGLLARKYLFILVALLILVYLAKLALFGNGQIINTNQALHHYEVQYKQLDNSQPTAEVEVLGEVKPQKTQVEIAQFSGWVDDIYVEPGDFIAKGQTLLKINTLSIDSEILKKRSERKSVALDIKIYRRNSPLLANEIAQSKVLLQRLNKVKAQSKILYDKKVVSLLDLEQRINDCEKQQLAVLRLENQLKNSALEIEKLEHKKSTLDLELEQFNKDRLKAVIVAAFDAVILEIKVSKGEKISPGSTLLKLAQYNRNRVDINWPTQLSQEPSAYQAYVIHQHQRIPMKLTKINRLISAGEAAPAAVLHFPDDRIELPLLGEIVSVYITLPYVANSFTIPPSALYRQRLIYRIVPSPTGDDTHQLQSISVNVSGKHHTDVNQSQWVIQSSQLQPGDKILTQRLATAVNGLLVIPHTVEQASF